MKWLETVEAQEDNILSFNQASTLINKYGDDLKGVFGMTSVATPASAEAVTQAKQCGKIAVVGLATPNAMKPYVQADCVKSVVLWNPVDLGYAATYVLRAVADGKLKPGDGGGGRQARQAERGQRQRGPARTAVRLQQDQHRQVRLLICSGIRREHGAALGFAPCRFFQPEVVPPRGASNAMMPGRILCAGADAPDCPRIPNCINEPKDRLHSST